MKQRYKLNLIKEYYYENNMTLQEVAYKFGYKSGVTIGNILRKNKLPIKKSNFNSKNRKHNLITNYFNKIDSNNKAYFLGLIIADGYVSNKWNKLTLALKDKKLVELFRNEIKSTHKLGRYEVYDNRTKRIYIRYSLQIPCKEMVDDLNKLGVYSNKSFTATMPNIDSKYFWHFLRGLFDGDGSVNKSKKAKIGRLKFSIIGSEKLLLHIRKKFDDIGLSNTKIDYTKYKSDDGCLIKLHYHSYNDLNILKEKMYENSNGVYLKRKYDLFQTLKQYKQGEYDHTKQLRKIKMFDLNGIYIKTFNNIHNVINEIGGNYNMIHRVAKGERNQTKGFKFKYI